MKANLYVSSFPIHDHLCTAITNSLTDSASDAYAGLQLFYVLDERRKGLDPQPELPHHAELGLPIPFPRVPTPEVSDSEAESGYTSSEDLDVEENRAPAQPQSTDAAAQKAARSPSQDARIEQQIQKSPCVVPQKSAGSHPPLHHPRCGRTLFGQTTTTWTLRLLPSSSATRRYKPTRSSAIFWIPS